MIRVSSFAVVAVATLVFSGFMQAQNPTPNIMSFSPPAVYAGGSSFTLTVRGTGFVSSTVVYWSPFNPPLATTYVSSTQVSAVVPADYILSPATEYIFASNPPPGGGNSSEVAYSVIDVNPSISSIAPIAVVAGSGATTLTVNGYNFMNGASITANNTKLSTIYVNTGELEAQLTASEVSKPAIVQIAVQNPAPGGLAPSVNFDLSYPALVGTLDIPANDLIWDPNAKLIYASLPSSYGPNGNSIAVINPANGKITAYHFVGSEPNQLALSADSSYLYVGLDGNGSVQRMILPSFALDIDVGLGSSEFGGVNVASGLQVSPGDSHTFAVALGAEECCGYGGPLEFFTDSTQLPNSITYPSVSSIQFANSSTLYGYSDSTLIEVAVNSSGGTLTTQWDTLADSASIVYDAELIYGSSGGVFNPATGELIGDYDTEEGIFPSSNALLPEANVGSTFVIGTTPFFSSFGVTSYDLSHFTPNAVIDLSQFAGEESPSVSSFISWGNDGLAFVLGSGCCGSNYYQTILVESKMMDAQGGKIQNRH